MNKTNDFKYNLPAYSDPVDIEDLNDNFRGIDDALMAGLCKKDYTGNNMGSSDPSARKYAWAPWLEIVNDNEFDVVVTDRNAPVESEEATINIAAGQTFRKYINGRYYMNFYVQDQHDVTFKWFTNAETYINESGGGGTGTVTSVSVQGGSGSHLTGSGNPIETSGTITINVDEGYSIPSDNEQTAWDGKAADLKAEINSSTYVMTLQLKDSAGNLIGSEKTIDLPLETMVVDGEYDSQTKKIKLELKNGNYVEFSVADLVSGLQTELSASNKLDPDYIDYDSTHRAVTDTEKDTWNGKQNVLTFDDTPTQNSNNPVKSGGVYSALAGKQTSLDNTQLAAVNSGIDSTKVGQISTNQTNILYSTRTGAQNLIVCNDLEKIKRINTYSSWTWEGNVYKSGSASFTVNGDGSITVNGAFNGQTFFYVEDDYQYDENESRFKGLAESKLWGCPAGGTDSTYFLSLRRIINGESYYYNDYGSGINVGTIASTAKIELFIAVRANTTVSNKTFYPSFTLKSIYDQDSSYCLGALPNYDLTYLEAQDRAALAEEIDAGAKNLFDWTQSYQMDNCSVSNGVYTAQGDTATTLRLQITLYNSGGIVQQIANTSGKGYTPISANGVYEFPFTYTGGDWFVIGHNGSTYNGRFRQPTTGLVNGKQYVIRLEVTQATNASGQFKWKDIMICTKAAFGVSKAYVPYRPNYDLVAMSVWKYTETTYTNTANNVYENTGISFTVPKNRSVQFYAYDRKNAAYMDTIVVCDSQNNITSQSTAIVAMNSITSSDFTDSQYWTLQTTGIIPTYNADVTYYVWVKRKSTGSNPVGLAYRFI